MELINYRLHDDGDSTIGALYIDGEMQCFTLEDEKRNKKVYGETRIPEGRYDVTFRKVGGFHQRYGKRYPDIHEGMLWIRGIPNFKYVLIHIGNDDEDTAGCLLVGTTAQCNQFKGGFVGYSTYSYKKVYPKVRDALKRGEKVTIEFKDLQKTN